MLITHVVLMEDAQTMAQNILANAIQGKIFLSFFLSFVSYCVSRNFKHICFNLCMKILKDTGQLFGFPNRIFIGTKIKFLNHKPELEKICA